MGNTVAFGDSNKQGDEDEKTHTLAEAAVDVSSVELAPSTSAVEVIPEETVTREPNTDTGGWSFKLEIEKPGDEKPGAENKEN